MSENKPTLFALATGCFAQMRGGVNASPKDETIYIAAMLPCADRVSTAIATAIGQTPEITGIEGIYDIRFFAVQTSEQIKSLQQAFGISEMPCMTSLRAALNSAGRVGLTWPIAKPPSLAVLQA